jgi:hypothetical protein
MTTIYKFIIILKRVNRATGNCHETPVPVRSATFTQSMFRYGEHLTNYKNNKFQARIAVLKEAINIQAF